MAAKGKHGLGMGMSALFGETESAPAEENLPVTTLPLSRVEPRQDQPRTEFDEEALRQLADSIREYGLIQPITVRPLDRGYYQIIAGERRWRASRMAGLTEVPVRIIEADDRTTAEMALVENLQREDLNPLEEARGYKKLMADYGLTQEEVAVRVQKSRREVKGPLSRSRTTDWMKPRPIFFTAARPKRMPSSSTVKPSKEWLISGGSRAMPQSRHSAM